MIFGQTFWLVLTYDTHAHYEFLSIGFGKDCIVMSHEDFVSHCWQVLFIKSFLDFSPC